MATINGTAGNDMLTGDDGDDIIHGLGGDDVIDGRGGSNQLFGDDGNDSFTISGASGGTIDGGAGFDTLSFSLSGQGVEITSTDGVHADILVSNGTNSVTNFEQINVTGAGGSFIRLGNWLTDLKIVDDSSNAEIRTGHGNDTVTITHGGGNAYINGGSDTVTFGGGTGQLHIIGVSGAADHITATIPDNNHTSSFILISSDALTANGANFDLATGIGTIGAATFALSGFDNIQIGGSAHVSTLSGNDAANLFYWDDASVTGNLILDGRGGNDELFGGAGNDQISGGTGDDDLNGQGANDTVHGGDGDDYLRDGGIGNNMLYGDGGNDHIFGNTTNGSLASATLTSGSDTIDAGDGSDYAEGSAHGDLIHGGAGSDVLYGDNRTYIGSATDADTIFGDDGNDHINGMRGNDTIDGGAGNDDLRGGQDDDVIMGGDGTDVLMGDLGNDHLNGNKGSDRIDGGDGDDYLRGGQDNDSILGGTGNDTVLGDLGNDTLQGGAGIDVLTGGDGADTFQFVAGDAGFTTSGAAANQTDAIVDLIIGTDKIGLSLTPVAILTGAAQPDFATAATLAQSLFDGHAGDHEVAAIGVGSDTYLFFSGTGGGTIDSAIVLDQITPSAVGASLFI